MFTQQCEAPRKLQHGDWNTVEFWPSEDPTEREVQFILFLSYDILGDLAPVDTGIVMTCMGGVSELNAFLGNDVDPDKIPEVEIDNVPFEAHFSKTDNDYVLGFSENTKVYNAMRKSQRLTASFYNIEGILKDLEFDTFGFDEVTKGWAQLCYTAKS